MTAIQPHLFGAGHAEPPWILGAPRLKLLAAAHVGWRREKSGRNRQAVGHPLPAYSSRKRSQARNCLPKTAWSWRRPRTRPRLYRRADPTRTLLEGPLADEARFALGKLQLNRFREDFEIARVAFAKVAASGGLTRRRLVFVAPRSDEKGMSSGPSRPSMRIESLSQGRLRRGRALLQGLHAVRVWALPRRRRGLWPDPVRQMGEVGWYYGWCSIWRACTLGRCRSSTI